MDSKQDEVVKKVITALQELKDGGYEDEKGRPTDAFCELMAEILQNTEGPIECNLVMSRAITESMATRVTLNPDDMTELHMLIKGAFTILLGVLQGDGVITVSPKFRSDGAEDDFEECCECGECKHEEEKETIH